LPLIGVGVWLLVVGQRLARVVSFGPLEVSFDTVDEIARSRPAEIQEVAASQIKLLTSFYNTVLEQARRSFRWAIIGVGVGLLFFLSAIAFLLSSQPENVATMSAVAGGLVEVIAGINFVLYAKTTAQLATFHERLERTQRFLLANSLVESLDGEPKTSTRARLVLHVAGIAETPGSNES
jgi:uncharacterized membrane protein